MKQLNFLFFTLFFVLILLLPSCGSKQVPQNTLLAAAIGKQTKDMNFDEANMACQYYEKENDKDMYVKCSQRMLAVGGNQEDMRKTTLKLAQLFLDQGDFEKAQKHALEYQTLYPGSKDAKEASYINIKAHFLATLDANRDQSKTQKTIELAQNFMDKHKFENQENLEHRKAVQSILDSCYRKLIDSEIGIINSYLSRYEYSKAPGALLAAHKRMNHIKEKLKPHSNYNESEIKQIELVLAQAGPIPNIVVLKAADKTENIA